LKNTKPPKKATPRPSWNPQNNQSKDATPACSSQISGAELKQKGHKKETQEWMLAIGFEP